MKKQQSGFYPERQFHLLINFNNDERSVALLPDETGKFLVIDQGKILGELGFDKQLNCVISELEDLDEAVLNQLNMGVKDHFA